MQGATPATLVVLSTEDGNVSVWQDFCADDPPEAVAARVPGTIRALAVASTPGGGFLAAAATTERGVQLLRGKVGADGALAVAASGLGAVAGPASPAQACLLCTSHAVIVRLVQGATAEARSALTAHLLTVEKARQRRLRRLS